MENLDEVDQETDLREGITTHIKRKICQSYNLFSHERKKILRSSIQANVVMIHHFVFRTDRDRLGGSGFSCNAAVNFVISLLIMQYNETQFIRAE